MVIKLNTRVFNVIRQVQKGGIFTEQDFRNIPVIAGYMRMVKEEETAIWIETNQSLFLQGLLEGFEIDNNQEAQLKDLLTQYSLLGKSGRR